MATVKFSYPAPDVNDLTPAGFYLPFRLSGGVYGQGTDINRQQDDADSYEANQELARSQGGTDMVDSYGPAKRIWQLTMHIWLSSPAAPDGAPHYYSPHEIDLADVERFVNEYVCWGVNPFYWTDYSGTVRRVRLISGSLDPRPYGRDECWVSFTLKEA